ncbi:MAG: hypothetical protein ACI9NN_001594, partial [Bacteroidia bacterium]
MLSSDEWKTTWYVRDASGNVMATYAQLGSEMSWEEAHIYGSSRLGMYRPQLVLTEQNCLGELTPHDLYNIDPNDPSFDQMITDMLTKANLSNVSSAVFQDFRNAIVQAHDNIMNQSNFDIWMDGLISYMCAFKDYNLHVTNDFN